MRARILICLVAVLPMLMVGGAALYCWQILQAQ
jgi:hypothetical protein